jgi:CRP-like cAMP-binding protein
MSGNIWQPPVKEEDRNAPQRLEYFFPSEESGSVFYLQSGAVKIAATSSTGKEAVVALLRPGDFFGEGSIAGQPLRVSTATAMELSSALVIALAFRILKI